MEEIALTSTLDSEFEALLQAAMIAETARRLETSKTPEPAPAPLLLA